MDKEIFFSMEKNKRAAEVNKLLAGSNQKEVSETIGISQSLLSKEMTKEDFIYVGRENKYFKFVRDPKVAVAIKNSNNSSESPEMVFLRDNLEQLQSLLEERDGKTMLSLNKEIYDDDSELVNKNIRINSVVYGRFVEHCSEQFPYLKIQDLIAQSLLDFVSTYSIDSKPLD